MAPETDPTNAPSTDRAPRLTHRERRRRIILLIVLFVLLAALAYATYYFAQNRRLPVLDIAAPVAAVQPPRHLFSIAGTGVDELQSPVGVGVSADGRVYAVDFQKRRVSVFSNSGRFLFAFNKTATDVLRNPVHLWVKGEEVWVTDRRHRKIFIFNLDGEFIREFAPKNEELAWTPLALAFTPEGELRVTDVGDTRNHRLLYFSEDGSRTATVGRTHQALTPDDEPGGFYFPNGLAVAEDGRVFVSDGDNRRIQVFDEDGKFQAFVDTSGVPRGIAIDEEQRLYVVDAIAHTIDIYDLKGERLTQFGSQGFGPGQFNYPNDIALDARGRIYVSDRDNNQVQVWGWPVAEPPALAAPKTLSGWLACLSPLLLLPLLLLLRKTRFVVTPDFVEAIVAAGEVSSVAKRRRIRLMAPEEDRSLYEGRVVDDVDLGTLIEFDVHSESDARAMAEKYELDQRSSVLISMASRVKALCTEDRELRRDAVLAEIRSMSFDEFRKTYLDS